MTTIRRKSLIYEHSLEPPWGGMIEHQGSLIEVDTYHLDKLMFTIYGYGTRNQWDAFMDGRRALDFPRFAGALDRKEVEALHSTLTKFLEKSDAKEEETAG